MEQTDMAAQAIVDTPGVPKQVGTYRLSIKGNHICSIYADNIVHLYGHTLYESNGAVVLAIGDATAKREGITITKG